MNLQPNFEINDKVKYTPYLSGYDNDKILTIDERWFEPENDLEKAFGIVEPKWLYSFKEIPNLVASEKDIVKQ